MSNSESEKSNCSMQMFLEPGQSVALCVNETTHLLLTPDGITIATPNDKRVFIPATKPKVVERVLSSSILFGSILGFGVGILTGILWPRK